MSSNMQHTPAPAPAPAPAPWKWPHTPDALFLNHPHLLASCTTSCSRKANASTFQQDSRQWVYAVQETVNFSSCPRHVVPTKHRSTRRSSVSKSTHATIWMLFGHVHDWFNVLVLATLHRHAQQPGNDRHPQEGPPNFDTAVEGTRLCAGSSIQTVPSTSHAGATGKPPRKRKRGDTSEQSKGKDVQNPRKFNQERANASPKLKSPKGQRPSKSPRLACPFCKSDPGQFGQCSSWGTDKPSHVKQHIYRTHEKYYCNACVTLFDTIEGLQTHERQTPRCEVSDFVLPPGFISLQQSEELHSRIPKEHNTIESQWFYIFNVVCPGLPRPASPWNDFAVIHGTSQGAALPVLRNSGLLPPDVSDARGFLTSSTGVSIVLQQFQHDAWFRQHEVRLREGLAHGFEEAFSSWAIGSALGTPRSQHGIHDQLSADGAAAQDVASYAVPQPEYDSQPGRSNWLAHNEQDFADAPGQAGGDLFPGELQQSSDPLPAQNPVEDEWLGILDFDSALLDFMDGYEQTWK